MLNEHTLKIKQFFRKLIITNKCNVKKLNIWLFGLYIMRIFSDGNYLWCFCEEKYLDFADFCLVTCLIWLVILPRLRTSSKFFDFTKIAVFSTQFTQIWRRMLLCRNSFGPKIWLWWASQIFIFARILGKLKEREGNLMRKINLMVHLNYFFVKRLVPPL